MPAHWTRSGSLTLPGWLKTGKEADAHLVERAAGDRPDLPARASHPLQPATPVGPGIAWEFRVASSDTREEGGEGVDTAAERGSSVLR